MEGTALIVGMIIAIICVAFGYVMGAEVSRMAHRQAPKSPKIEERDDTTDADWWRNGVRDDDDQG